MEVPLDLCRSTVLLRRGHRVASNAYRPMKGCKVFSSLIDETLHDELSALENAVLMPRSHHVDEMTPHVLVLHSQLFSKG